MRNHSHKIEDSRARSLLKSLSGYALEVGIDTLLIGTILSVVGISKGFEIGFGLSVATEFICFLTKYFNDRFWNRIQWGRKIVDVIT